MIPNNRVCNAHSSSATASGYLKKIHNTEKQFGITENFPLKKTDFLYFFYILR